MEFWTAVAVLRRRWYVFIPGLVITVVVAVVLGGQAKPVYKAVGSVRLVRPASDPTTSSASPSPTLEGGSNPISDGDPLQNLNLMALVADNGVFRDQVIAAGGSGNYEVVPPFGNTPSLGFTTTAASPERAMADYSVLIKTFDEMVVAKQEGSPPRSIVRVDELIHPNNAFPQNAARTKGMIIIGLVGFLLSIGASFLFDSMMAARHRRRYPVDQAGELVSLANLRSPLDELTELDSVDDPEGRGSRRALDAGSKDGPGRKAGGLGGNPMRW